VAGAWVFDAADPEPGAVALDWEVLVDQNRCAMGGEGLDDRGGIVGDVVVAEDGVAERSGKGGEDLGAAVQSVATSDEGEGAVGDEVAGDEDEIGGKGIDLANDVLKEKGLGVLVEVDVAELDDTVAAKGCGKVCDGDRAIDDVDFVASDLAGVKS